MNAKKINPTTKLSEDRDVGEARVSWEHAHDEASRLSKEYLADGSGYGDPTAQEGDKHRLDTAKYEKQQRYREYQDILSRAERSSHNEEDKVAMSSIDVFISHSSRDSKMAKLLVQLIKDALHVSPKKIRCTSVNGYRLPAGADATEQLRNEVVNSKAFIGLVSQTSKDSLFVLFELGARWGSKKKLFPLMGPGVTPSDLKQPLGSLNALSCSDSGQIHQLISDLGEQLGVDLEKPAVYEQALADFVASSKQAEAELENTDALLEK